MQSGCREMKTRIESSHACAHSRTNNDLCTTFTVPSSSSPPHHSIPTTTAADYFILTFFHYLKKERTKNVGLNKQILVPSLSLTHLLCHHLSCCLSPVHILSAVLSFSLSLAEDTKKKKSGIPMYLMLFYSSGMAFTDTVTSQ